MQKNANVTVTWHTILDGKTRQGINLKGILEDLLRGEYILEIDGVPNGNRTFENVEEFSAWYDGLG